MSIPGNRMRVVREVVPYEPPKFKEPPSHYSPFKPHLLVSLSCGHVVHYPMDKPKPEAGAAMECVALDCNYKETL